MHSYHTAIFFAPLSSIAELLFHYMAPIHMSYLYINTNSCLVHLTSTCLFPCIFKVQEHSAIFWMPVQIEAITGRICIRTVHKVIHQHIMHCKTSWSVKGSADCQNIQLTAPCQNSVPCLMPLKLFEYS